MATTIPGGYYLGTDGKPHDANGKPLPVRVLTPPVEVVKDDLPAAVAAPAAPAKKSQKAGKAAPAVAAPDTEKLSTVEEV